MLESSASPFLLFETSLPDKDNSKTYLFTEPIDAIKINCFKEVEGAFDRIERYSRKYFLAGYFAYELGYYFEDFSRKADTFPFPLIYLYVFDRVKILTAADDMAAVKFSVTDLKFNLPRADYLTKIERIKGYIEQGDTYQVNFTGKYRFDFSGSAYSFYQDLKKKQNVPYGAFCSFGDEDVISLSPELFFRRDGVGIISRPMKGTIDRGRDARQDRQKALSLKRSGKEIAENVMIVDLVRNDLGRICEAGSVKVSERFRIERYNTLFQMTSDVCGTLNNRITYFDIFRNIFPGGSVTGAPKIKTMQIIREIEDGYRGVYCGALGIIFPGKKAVFNMPIRTIRLVGGKGEMGIGSGITYDSDPAAEFRECGLKARFLTGRYKDFRLLETILWDGEYRFLEEHLIRLKRSARYFAFRFSRQALVRELGRAAKKFKKGINYRTRLLVGREGGVSIEYSEIYGYGRGRLKRCLIAVSKRRVKPSNVFLYHKTTNRALYDREYAHYSKEGYADVIFLNERGEVTEGAVSNVIIKRAGKYYTPPVSCGLLPGVFRDYFIKRYKAQEKILTLKDLRTADKIFICNSVRGLIEVRICGRP